MHRSKQQTPGVSGLRAFFVSVARSRGTGPRATGSRPFPLHRRARACPSPSTDLSSKHPGSRGCGRSSFRLRDRGGQAPALRVSRPFPLHRRARACPSPGTGLNRKQPGSRGCGRFSFRLRDRGGQAPALRVSRPFFVSVARSRGTGPRATGVETVSPSP